MAGQQAEQGVSSPRQQILAVVDTTAKAVTAYGRPDLLDRLSQTRRRLREPGIRVVVTGEYKQGKSSLINALVAANVCPVDDDIATAVPTTIRYADAPVAHAILESEAGDGEAKTEPIPFDEVAGHVTERGDRHDERRLLGVEVGIPRGLLETGLILVDTPGVGGLASAHSSATYATLPSAQALLFVTDAAQELTAPEIDFLRSASEVCPNVFCVLTKVDFYPQWRRILELDRGHLRDAGIEAAVFPISTALRFRALNTQDQDLNRESGYPELVTFLREQIVGQADRLAVRSAVADQLSMISQIEGTLRSEREALAHPENGAALLAALTEAKQRADRLRSESARWQQTLADGFTDLTSEVEFDMRSRLRRFSQEADEAIDQTDPGKVWAQFEQWLQQRVAWEVSENYLMIARDSERLADRVAEHFASAETEIELPIEIVTPDDALGIDLPMRVEAAKKRVAGSVLTALRGSFGGASMVGMVGGMVGVAVMSPVAAAAGILMGGKAVREERQRSLLARRQQAKAGHRKYVEEISFLVSKHTRDTMRRAQRQMRDHFTSLAEELQRSRAQALAAAQQALQSDQAQRQRRLANVDAELARVAGLHQRVAAFAPELARGRAS